MSGLSRIAGTGGGASWGEVNVLVMGLVRGRGTLQAKNFGAFASIMSRRVSATLYLPKWSGTDTTHTLGCVVSVRKPRSGETGVGMRD